MGYFVRFTEKGSQHYFEFDHDLDHLVLEGLYMTNLLLFGEVQMVAKFTQGLEKKNNFRRLASDFEISYQVSYVLVRDKITSNILKLGRCME